MIQYAAAYREADFLSVLKAFARRLGAKVAQEALRFAYAFSGPWCLMARKFSQSWNCVQIVLR